MGYVVSTKLPCRKKSYKDGKLGQSEGPVIKDKYKGAAGTFENK